MQQRFIAVNGVGKPLKNVRSESGVEPTFWADPWLLIFCRLAAALALRRSIVLGLTSREGFGLCLSLSLIVTLFRDNALLDWLRVQHSMFNTRKSFATEHSPIAIRNPRYHKAIPSERPYTKYLVHGIYRLRGTPMQGRTCSEHPKFRTMHKTVGEHIRDLESRRQRLNEESLEDGLSQERRNEIDAEIRAITSAISHFLAAIEKAQQLKFGKELQP